MKIVIRKQMTKAKLDRTIMSNERSDEWNQNANGIVGIESEQKLNKRLKEHRTSRRNQILRNQQFAMESMNQNGTR